VIITAMAQGFSLRSVRVQTINAYRNFRLDYEILAEVVYAFGASSCVCVRIVGQAGSHMNSWPAVSIAVDLERSAQSCRILIRLRS